ncbi:MAG: hypothetical protein AAF547_15475 [Actinomycetota bacterium]
MGRHLGGLVPAAAMTVAVAVLMIFGSAIGWTPAGATTATIVDALDRDGRYLELSDAALDASVDDANSLGVAFVWLDRSGDEQIAQALADQYVDELDELGSRYTTVLVLTSEAYAAFSIVFDESEIGDALDASFESFSAGSPSRGLTIFTNSLDTALGTATTVPSTDGGTTDGDDGGGGIGIGAVLLAIAVLGGGFLFYRRWASNRRAKARAALDLEEDRVEIEEQLKNNADRVISLGDRVIASGDRELIDLYQEASSAYQDVSHSIDDAETAAEIDDLDDRIDEAEWQFELIEARLDGRPDPPSPEEVEAAAEAEARRADAAEAPPPPAPRRGPDDSVVTSPTTGRTYPRSGRRTTSSRGRSGGLGGAMAGGLGGVLADIVFGGGLGQRSRRTQRRSGFPGGFGSVGTGSTRRTTSAGGGLGGGVLRRGGSSPSRSRTRSTSSGRSRRAPSRSRQSGRRSGGGRNLGGGRGAGGGRRL